MSWKACGPSLILLWSACLRTGLGLGRWDTRRGRGAENLRKGALHNSKKSLTENKTMLFQSYSSYLREREWKWVTIRSAVFSLRRHLGQDSGIDPLTETQLCFDTPGICVVGACGCGIGVSSGAVFCPGGRGAADPLPPRRPPEADQQPPGRAGQQGEADHRAAGVREPWRWRDHCLLLFYVVCFSWCIFYMELYATLLARTPS